MIQKTRSTYRSGSESALQVKQNRCEMLKDDRMLSCRERAAER
jgi:hypothetical protein